MDVKSFDKENNIFIQLKFPNLHFPIESGMHSIWICLTYMSHKIFFSVTVPYCFYE